MKKYKLLKDIQSPMDTAIEGTMSEKEGDYYIFPYMDKKYNDDNNGWMGNGFMILNPELYPEWFVEIKEEEKDDPNSREYKIAVLSWKLVNKIHNEGMPNDLWKRRQFFIDYLTEQFRDLWFPYPYGSYVHYSGETPEEVEFNNKVYILKEKVTGPKEPPYNIKDVKTLARKLPNGDVYTLMYKGANMSQNMFETIFNILKDFLEK